MPHLEAACAGQDSPWTMAPWTDDGGVLVVELTRDGATPFAPHGHLVRLCVRPA